MCNRFRFGFGRDETMLTTPKAELPEKKYFRMMLDFWKCLLRGLDLNHEKIHLSCQWVMIKLLSLCIDTHILIYICTEYIVYIVYKEYFFCVDLRDHPMDCPSRRPFFVVLFFFPGPRHRPLPKAIQNYQKGLVSWLINHCPTYHCPLRFYETDFRW